MPPAGAAEPAPVRAILTDIEGTTTPIAFVRDVLFPYARTRLAAFLASHANSPDVAASLDEVRVLAPGQDPLKALLGWMADDAKVTPLKALQGSIWHQGYLDGSLKGELYDDVAPALRRWSDAGLRLYVYSSGSEASQRLLFGHSAAGDLAVLFEGFFDTKVGGKREAESYRRITAAIGMPAREVLFLSDIEEELDAAAEAGLATCQLVRPDDHTKRSLRHLAAANFQQVRTGGRAPPRTPASLK